MAYKVISPMPIENDDIQRVKQRVREQLDKSSIGWKGVQLIAQDLFGKTKNFSLVECRKLLVAAKKQERMQ